MFIRCAFFLGRVKPGHAEAFTRYVEDRLVPLWTRFPGAQESACYVRPAVALKTAGREGVLAIRYGTSSTLSPQRNTSLQWPERVA